MESNKGLGRGLDALFGNQSVTADDSQSICLLRPDQIVRSPWQPRQHFDADALEALAASIRKHGILEPVIVRPVNGSYEIIAGERRFQAAIKAGLAEIPVTVRKIDDRTTVEIALSENLEREDLSPIEIAQSFSAYLQTFGSTQEELAQRLGKDRSTVANLIRLLDLPSSVQKAVTTRAISAGHARALLPLKDERRINAVLVEIIQKQLSVRQTEALVRRLLAQKTPQQEKKSTTLSRIEDTMQRYLATRVNIRGKVSKGVIEISYFTQEDLLRILDLLSYQKNVLNK